MDKQYNQETKRHKKYKRLWTNRISKIYKKSKYIVTTSFHGVALSVALNKQFFYGLSKEKNNFNSRIISLVDILKLCDRDIASYSNDKIQNINYDEINIILEKQREISLEYLKKVLSE